MAQSFSPIQSRIQKTLFDKMSMLEKQSSVISREKDASGNFKSSETTNYRIGSPLSTQTGNAKQNYMMGRSTWMRMVSLEVPASGAPVILMGGEADSQGNFVGNLWGKKTGATKTTTSAIPNSSITSPEELQHGRYWTEGESQPFRPSPGIKDIRVEHKLMAQAGGGAPTRTTEINWICWTWQDLDRLTKHFLQPGMGVFVDWGWSGLGVLKEVELFDLFKRDSNDKITGISNEKLATMQQKLSGHIVEQNGHYDGILGLVYNFEWKVRDDGGFDCVTQIIGQSSGMLDVSLKIGSEDLKARLPFMFVDTVKDHYEEEYYKGEHTTTSPNYRNIEITTLHAGEGERFEENYIVPVWASDKHTGNTKAAQDILSAKLTNMNVGSALKEYDSPNLPVETQRKKLASDAKAITIVRKLDESKYTKGNLLVDHILYVPGNDLVVTLNPWITFDDYLNDIYSQVWNSLNNSPALIKSGNIINTLDKDGMAGLYVTWGWFEDNILSRFFAQLSAGEDSEIQFSGTFRSFEDITVPSDDESVTHSEETMGSVRKQKEAGKTDADIQGYNEKWMKAWNDWSNWKDGGSNTGSGETTETKVQSKITNNKFMVTTDMSKFLLINKGTPTRTFVENTWGVAGLGRDLGNHHSWHDKGWIGKSLGNLKHFTDPENSKWGILRNVYWNVEYIKKIMMGGGTLTNSILKLWRNGFSAEFGDLFQFQIKKDDNDNRIILSAKDWTLVSVDGMINNKSHRANPKASQNDKDYVDNFEGLFEFPVWKEGSMVKSQNLTATIPTALKNAMMLHGSGGNSKEMEMLSDAKQREAKAFGALTQPKLPPPGGSVQDDVEQSEEDGADVTLLRSIISGKIDFPGRRNRKFGLNSANIDEKLVVGDLDGSGTEGIKIDKSILHQLIADNHDLYWEKVMGRPRKKEDSKSISGDAEAKFLEMEKERADFLSKFTLDSNGDTVEPSLAKHYIKTKYDDPSENFYYKIESNYRDMLTDFLKSDDGPVGEIDPFIPIDFDMDIDGIGGIFPGNAFTSNYLPSRYKKMTGFEVKGVEQRVDSAGWTTSIKGQMRVSMKSRYDSFKDREETFEIQGYNPFQALPIPPALTVLGKEALRRVLIPDIIMIPIVDVLNLSENDPPVVDKEVANGVLTEALDQDKVTDVGNCTKYGCSYDSTLLTAAAVTRSEYEKALSDQYNGLYYMWLYLGEGVTMDNLREEFPAWSGAQFDEVIQNFENLVHPGDN